MFDRTFAYEPVPIDPAYPDSLIEAFATRVAGSDFGNPAGLRDAETVEWLVLDSSGEPMARVRLPDRFQLREARADRVWGWAVDELDVPYIYRYGIGERGE